MKLEIDPMAALRQKRKERVNANFSTMFVADSHRHAAHARKREVASLVIGGGTPPEAFQKEADMRGLSVVDLAKLILSKECDLDRMELHRQKVLANIDAAQTVDELEKVGNVNG